MSKLCCKLILILSSLLWTGCGAVSTNKPDEAYRRWAGEKPPPDMKVRQGQYWQSGHWSHEYIVYLKLLPAKKWWAAFIRQNNLVANTSRWTLPEDAPKWFSPSAKNIKWKAQNDFQGSQYLQDTLTGDYYVYEIQL